MRQSVSQRLTQALGIIADDSGNARLAAGFANLRGQDEAVVFGQLPAPRLLLKGDELAACGDDDHPWPPPRQNALMPAAGQRAQIDRAQLMVHLQDGFRSDHVLAHQAHMLPGRDGSIDEQRLLVSFVDILDHDDGVAALGQGVAGIDRVGVLTQAQSQRLSFSRGNSGGRVYRVAIHGRAVKMRRRAARAQRLGGHPPQRISQGHKFPIQRTGASGGQQRRLQLGPRLVQRNVFQVDLALCHQRFSNQP